MLKKGLLILSFVLIFAGAVGVYLALTDNDVSGNRSEDTVDVINVDTRYGSDKPVDFSHIEVPDLPFAENPDPEECGIPQPWGADNVAYLSGEYQGDLIQPTVYLYDSHGRNAIVAAAKHGTEVEVVMFQANPVLNYYLVRIPGAPEGAREGWVPAPFLSFDPVKVDEA
ncbi:MAG: hypothetical protein L0154_12955 [Chloroflexi bacterium]|nr:hypothetical protein [Chloroflexota bacterium]